MATKTDRILGYLPGTFQALPRPTALYAVADAFGGELLAAENYLAEVMAAHWVDHADRGSEFILDLKQIAALYALAPRPDESVEEFRAHLKRYIRIFLEGTATVQGVLRVAAEALSLPIADAYEDMDTWWQRIGEELVTVTPRGDDAASLLLGLPAISAYGSDAKPAELFGTVALVGPFQPRPGATLRLAVDALDPVDIDLTGADGIEAIIAAINGAGLGQIATRAGSVIHLASPSVGPTARLEVAEVAGDAAQAVLGLPPRGYLATEIQTAKLVGSHDLSSGVDLSGKRFLRVLVDGTLLGEIDCGGANPESRSLDQIRDAINDALGLPLADHDGHFLSLASPTPGAAGSIALLEPAAHNAAALLFGPLEPLYLGKDAAPARFTGSRDLSDGVDLSQTSKIRLKIDGGAALTIDCAGADPARTRPDEIAATINGAIGQQIATLQDRFMGLTAPIEILFATPPEADATEHIFGLPPRLYRGQPARAAQITGSPDLGDGQNLWASYRLLLALDGAAAVNLDLRGGAADPANAGLNEITAGVNTGLGQTVASHDGKHLTLRSQKKGGDSSLKVVRLETTRKARFATRAFITEEASQMVFGSITKEARGTAASFARIVGSPDLNRGVDLRENRYLRLAIDGGPAVEIDCAGARPRATTAAEIAAKINAASQTVASVEGRHLALESPTEGVAGRIAFEPVLVHDGLSRLLGLPAGSTRGRSGTRIVFTGTVNLGGAPTDLPENAAVKLGVDDTDPLEIALGEGSFSLNALANKINTALGFAAAIEDGTHLMLASSRAGSDSRVEFAEPGGTDVTSMLFGISPPRGYSGEAAVSARVVSELETSGGLGLSRNLVLRLAVDGKAVDVAIPANEADPLPTSLAQVVATINEQMAMDVASAEADRLVLTSPIKGLAARIDLAAHIAGDARKALFGDVPDLTTGDDALPARLVGDSEFLDPVDLSRRGKIRLVVDGSRYQDIEVAGEVARTTFPDEVVAAINRVFPAMASLDEEGRLSLVSPTAGEDSLLRLEPPRALELIEYPPVPAAVSVLVSHGETTTLDNPGAAEVPLQIEIHAAQGMDGLSLTNLTTGLHLRLQCLLEIGESLMLSSDEKSGQVAIIHAVDGSWRPVPPDEIRIEPEGAAITVPRGRSRWLFTSCHVARFNRAYFNKDRFAGGQKVEQGVFDISRFGAQPPPPDQAVIAVFAGGPIEPPVRIDFRWMSHLPGTFRLHLPADLPARFGARFNQARFGQRGQTAQAYPDSVNEPLDDADHLVKLITNTPNSLVKAEVVALVPLGWVASVEPFRKPRFLTLGGPDQEAALYLQEEGVPGFIQLKAREKGAWGNLISVTARKSGPARFDVTLTYEGGRFENAREIARGEPLGVLAAALLKPSPVGVLQAKAAGITALISREGVEPYR